MLPSISSLFSPQSSLSKKTSVFDNETDKQNENEKIYKQEHKNVKGDLQIDPKKEFMKQFMSYSLEERKKNAERVLRKYSDKCPVIIFRANDQVNDIPNHKYLAPNDMAFSDFISIIRKYIKLDKSEALFYFIHTEKGNGDMIPKPSSLMSELYQTHKDNDLFLKLTYSKESTFG